MPGKMLSCPHCPKVMRSDNLKNHIQRHGDVQGATSYQPQPGHKRPSSSAQLLPIQSVSPVKNPKIQNLDNEILNNSAIVEGSSRPIPPIRQESTREKSNISKAVKNPKIQNLDNEILNDSAIVEGSSRPIPPIRQESTREKSNISKAVKNPLAPTLQNLPKKLVPLVLDINEDDPNLQLVNLLNKKSQPRAKHDI